MNLNILFIFIYLFILFFFGGGGGEEGGVVVGSWRRACQKK